MTVEDRVTFNEPDNWSGPDYALGLLDEVVVHDALVHARWAPIPSAPGYEASTCGQIRSVTRVLLDKAGRRQRHQGRLLKQRVGPQGYPFVAICRGGGQVIRRVHGLVLDAFVGSRPLGLVCCHDDGDPSNNHLSNLRWDTSSANQFDTVRHRRDRNSTKTHCAYGHPFDDVNTRLVLRPDGTLRQRDCRECRRRRRLKAETAA